MSTAAEKLQEIDFQAPSPTSAVPAVAEPAALPASASPIFDLIARAARDPSVDIDKMERLIAMQERVQAKQAQVEYDNAMATAQSYMKAIRADLSNDQTKSNYASYAALDKAVRPIYSAHGFSLSFDSGEGAPESCVRIVCKVAHRSGHRERHQLDMPADGKGAKGGDVMTKTHATGAAITYGKRYMLGMIFNLAVGDDDDGNGAGGWVDDAARDGLLKNGDRRSTYDQDKARKARESANTMIEGLNLSGNREAAKDYMRACNKAPAGKRVSPLAWLELHGPDQYARVLVAYENATGETWG